MSMEERIDTAMKTNSGSLLNSFEIQNLDETICSWNMQRIFAVLVMTLIFQLTNLLNRETYYTDAYLLSVITIILLCFVGILGTVALYFNNVSTAIQQKLYLAFWLIFPILLTHFYTDNMMNDDFPAAMCIIILLIAAFPVINMKQASLLLAVPVVLNIVLAFIYKPDYVYIIYMLLCSAAGFSISFGTHGKCMALLQGLNNSCTYDHLTSALNKSSGYQRATNMYEMCRRLEQPFCVYMLDIDFFKMYNDTFGHQAGDKALSLIAHCISSTFARKQDIVCRYGGEEFLICCTNKEAADFEMMAENLLDNIYDLRIESGNKSVAPYVTACIGYTVFINDDPAAFSDMTLDSLIKQADRALYKAKALGRNQCFRI